MNSRYAIALTTDGFETRLVPDAVWRTSITPHLAPDGSVLVVSHRRGLQLQVVSPEGAVREVDRSSSTRAVQAGEVVAGMELDRRGEPTFLATDVEAAVAHAVPAPAATQQLVQLESGQLRALGQNGRYHWSSDGGATWQRADVPDRGFEGSLMAPTVSAADTHAVVLGGDGATLFPFGFAARLDGAGAWTVVSGPRDPRAHLGGQVVLPGGRLLVVTTGWSDQGTFRRPVTGTRSGLYVSDGDDWSSLSRIAVGTPFDRIERWHPDLLDVSVVGDVVTLVLRGPDLTSAFASEDLGVTWTELPVR